MTVKILYLAHDLSDPTTMKRTTMLVDGGAHVTLAGFRRTDARIESVYGCKAVDWGQTFNGGFVQRLNSVLNTVLRVSRYRALFADADVILARNLEMLAIGVRGRSLCAKKPVIVYESLDIHRLLLGHGKITKALRNLEGWLSKRASALITSSPAFIRSYFNGLSKVHLPIKLVENKVYPLPFIPSNSPRLAGPPWKIGWFGAIRCRKSLDILSTLVKDSNGSIEVIIRGRPALDQFDDFHKITSATPGLQFLGPYKNPDELAGIYREVHFTWAIDMFEEGLNSAWLLPNRLYEGGVYGTVPLAIKDVETGKTLQQMGIGVTLEQPLCESLTHFFAALTADYYRGLENAVAQKLIEAWAFSQKDCINLVEYLRMLSEGGKNER